jgi:hypothetical protein
MMKGPLQSWYTYSSTGTTLKGQRLCAASNLRHVLLKFLDITPKESHKDLVHLVAEEQIGG